MFTVASIVHSCAQWAQLVTVGAPRTIVCCVYSGYHGCIGVSGLRWGAVNGMLGGINAVLVMVVELDNNGKHSRVGG